MKTLIDLSAHKIIVTGASSGIGKQTAITLSRLGASVILVARRQEALKEVLSLLEGNKHAYYVFDLDAIEEIPDLADSIVNTHGAVDGLFYAAGIGSNIPFMQLKPEKVQNVFATNLFAFMEMVRQISKKGRFNQGMSILGVSSIASICGDPAHAAYSASKAAMDGAVRCLAKEVSAKGIRVNTLVPAMTNTHLFEAYKERYGADSENYKQLVQRQYLGIAEPQEIANAAAFLLSPAAKFITGVCLPVDGGYTAN